MDSEAQTVFVHPPRHKDQIHAPVPNSLSQLKHGGRFDRMGKHIFTFLHERSKYWSISLIRHAGFGWGRVNVLHNGWYGALFWISKGGIFRVMALIFPRYCYMGWDSAVLEMAEHLPAPEKQWKNSLLCLHTWLLLSQFNYFYVNPQVF